MNSAIFFALCSNIAFASASVVFTDIANRTSPAWMNFVKGLIAACCFLAVCAIGNLWTPMTWTSFGYLVISGVCGLFIGDIFLLRAFTHLGSGRVLMLFSFQPLLLGIASYYLLGQSISIYRIFAILLLIGCLFSFAFESLKQKGHWDLPGLGFALLGISLDAIGLLLTRSAFDQSVQISLFQVNLIRSAATAIGFFIAASVPAFRFQMFQPWQRLNTSEKKWTVVASVLGTFVSLSCYMFAIRNGQLATLSALAGTSPLFATIYETATGKKKFTVYLLSGLIFFGAGVFVLLQT